MRSDNEALSTMEAVGLTPPYRPASGGTWSRCQQLYHLGGLLPLAQERVRLSELSHDLLRRVSPASHLPAYILYAIACNPFV